MEMLTLLGPLLALLPPWAANLLINIALLCTAASIFTALVPTPSTPDTSSTSIHRLWWRIYRAIELVAIVTNRVKQNPDVARALIAEAASLVVHSGATPLQRAAMTTVANHAPPQAVTVLAGVVSEATDGRPADAQPIQAVAANLMALAGKLR